jgi:ABC-type polysaccharide/polyol phosphate transport system ATPase subunit
MSEATPHAVSKAGHVQESNDASIVARDVELEYAVHRLRHPTLKGSVTGVFRKSRTQKLTLQALRGIDFVVKAGERVGIIGRNGAGKSSLLRTIAGIYRPTAGEINTQGFMVPLFQLGLGFHPELTATANILQAAALLGLDIETMRSRIPGILEFAELEEYADVPIKYLSTGMAMRLAFTTATEIPPDILLLDEVLTGGDGEFRERASARMEALVDRTSIVLLVSHALPIVRRLSSRVLWIDKGQVRMDGDPAEVIAAYKALTGLPPGRLHGSSPLRVQESS